ncbi:MAG TPA: glutathione S-transferase family protein [Polyangiaceae bacterium]|nr:glutathione S-transferase family protein [Polyangiaceae bacterium]
MSDLKLYSARACPFAHRTRLVLAEKGIDFELVEIDLQNKPAWFGGVSLYGKVPALEHAGQRLVESVIINEYLDEVFPEPRLLPRQPAQRALARIWIDFANTRLAVAFTKVLWGATESERETAKRDFVASLELIEREALAKLSGAGPYWLGAEPSLVDFSFYPWFERLPALQDLAALHLPRGLERLERWRSAVAARSSVRGIQNPGSFYLERYRAYQRPAAAPNESQQRARAS